MATDRKEERKNVGFLLTFATKALMILTAVTWGLVTSFLYRLYEPKTLEQWGQFGDTFGAINSLFSAAALVFIGRTFLHQLEESHAAAVEQRETLRLMRNQAEAAATSARLQALVFRVEFFTGQLNHPRIDTKNRTRMEKQQRVLLEELDSILGIEAAKFQDEPAESGPVT